VFRDCPTNNINCERPFAVYDRMGQIHVNASVHTKAGLTGAILNKTLQVVHAMPWERQKLLWETAFKRNAAEPKKTNEKVAESRAAKGELRRKAHEAAITKLENKTALWIASEDTELIDTHEKLTAANKKCRFAAPFIETIKGQCNYLMAHRGVKKSQLFTYNSVTGGREGFRGAWEGVIDRIDQGVIKLADTDTGVSPLARSLVRIKETMRGAVATADSVEYIRVKTEEYKEKEEELRAKYEKTKAEKAKKGRRASGASAGAAAAVVAGAAAAAAVARRSRRRKVIGVRVKIPGSYFHVTHIAFSIGIVRRMTKNKKKYSVKFSDGIWELPCADVLAHLMEPSDEHEIHDIMAEAAADTDSEDEEDEETIADILAAGSDDESEGECADPEKTAAEEEGLGEQSVSA
jgi:hypothetical protein